MIETWLSPASYLISASGINSFVLPSKTNSFGEIVYPFPKEEMPIKSNDDNGDAFIICGSSVEGLSV